mgnify:CR=1 FL=1
MVRQKKTASLGLAVILSVGVAACTNPYDPAQRTIGGGLLGAGAGAAIGAAAGGGPGAALGAAIGGATGAVAGAATTPPPPYGYYGGYPAGGYGYPSGGYGYQSGGYYGPGSGAGYGTGYGNGYGYGAPPPGYYGW